MSTFLGQLFGFLVILFVLNKFVVPPVRKLMADQKTTVRTQLDDNAKAIQRLSAADQFHAQRVDQGQVEAGKIVEEARTDSVRIAEQLRVQADVEAERIKVQGGQQVSLLRTQTIRALRAELGTESVERAIELVRAHVSDPDSQSATIDRFLDELDAMAPAASAPEVASDLRSASRDAQAALVARFDSLAGSMGGYELSTLAEELAAVDKLLLSEPNLVRHLAEATDEAEAKKQMLQRLIGGRVGTATMDVLDTAVSVRWSRTSDFVDAVEHIARLSLLARAEREYQAEEVAEQLFRFDRILEAEPQLSTLLSDASRPAEVRDALLRNVFDRAAGANPTAVALLTQTVDLLRGQRADEAVGEVAQLAVAHRGEVVAQVKSPTELTGAQRARLAQVLSRIYHHSVSVQVDIDPALMGGLSVAVGDEVIDGTLSSRLAAAETKLPD